MCRQTSNSTFYRRIEIKAKQQSQTKPSTHIRATALFVNIRPVGDGKHFLQFVGHFQLCLRAFDFILGREEIWIFELYIVAL
jgi:hypothetical protein